MISNSQQYDESEVKVNENETKTVYIPSSIPISASYALFEILEKGEVSTTALKYYSQIITTCLIRIGTANESSKDYPNIPVQKSIRNFFSCVDEDEIIEKLGF